jgi:hypothetical protein
MEMQDARWSWGDKKDGWLRSERREEGDGDGNGAQVLPSWGKLIARACGLFRRHGWPHLPGFVSCAPRTLKPSPC